MKLKRIKNIKVDGDHPIFIRALKYFDDIAEAETYANDLEAHGYENVIVERVNNE